MKKLIYRGLFLVTVGIGLLACNKQNDLPVQKSNNKILVIDKVNNSELLNSIIEDFNSLEKANPNWWARVKKWFKAHTGTHLFDNCQYSNPCGPCPGLCLRFGKVMGDEIDSDVVTPSDYKLGLRAFGLYLVENRITHEESVLFVFNKDVSYFLNDNRLFIERDIYADTTITDALKKESIKFIKGIYPVSLDTISGYYFALVNTKIK